MNKIEGLVKDKVFHDIETGFHILRVQLKDKTKISVKGSSPISVTQNDYITFNNSIINIVKPTEIDAIKSYLSSGIIKGLTKKNATDLVKAWGTDAINIIENNPEQLLRIKGIGEAKLNTILESWEENKPRKHDTDELMKYGFNDIEAVKIIQRFNGDSLETLQNNPYLISKRVKQVDFKKIDEIAIEMGEAKDSTKRIAACIDYFLSSSHEKSGDCIIDRQSLMTKVKKYIKLDNELLLNNLESLIENELIHQFEVDNIKFLQSMKINRVEKELSRRMFNLTYNFESTKHDIKDLSRADEKKLTLSEEQLNAVYNCVNEKVSVLTGGPGTGKTTTINEIIKQLKELDMSVLLCAPTGKAAQRMKESTGCRASTIHRLLEFNPREMRFDINESNPLVTDVIIIDESSMIDIYLMMHLLKAINNETKVIIVGDTNQLISIGEGSVLRDIIDSKLVKTSRLQKIFRQAEESKIITNAYDINEGKFDFNHKPTAKEDFFFIESDNDSRTLEIIKHITNNKIEQSFGFNKKEDLQILSSQHKGLLGTNNMNVFMQDLLNNETNDYLLDQDFNFKVGDRIIQTVNNYDKSIFNGDCGVIKLINKAGILVKFDNMKEEVEYNEKDMKELAPSYCLSIHKSQGSEYPVVIIPIPEEYSGIIDRSLLYTGITRGKSIVILVGNKNTLETGIQSDASRLRKTYLKEHMINFFEEYKNNF